VVPAAYARSRQWHAVRAAPNFTKLVQLERTAKACVRSCAKGGLVCGRSCVQLSGSSECGEFWTGSSLYLRTFFSLYVEPI